MAESDLVNGTIKCLTLPAALIGTIQGLAWVVLSLISILYYTEIIEISTTISVNDYGYIIYSLYLRSPDVAIGIPDEFLVTPKIFNIVMYIYLVLSFIWLLLSLCMIWVVVRQKWRNISNILICWSVVTVGLAAVDISFMGVLAADLQKAHDFFNPTTPPTTTIATTIDQTTTTIDPTTTTIDPTTTTDTGPIMRNSVLRVGTPSEQEMYTAMGIVMSLAARGYILWLVNVVFAIILLVVVNRFGKSTRPSMMQRPFINGYEGGPRPFSIYDQVEIDKSFQNEGFRSDEHIFSRRPTSDPYANDSNSNNIFGKNPLSNSNRSSLVYGQTPSYPFENNKPVRLLPPVNQQQNGKLAKIGKGGGRRSPPQPIPSPSVPHLPNMPYIPDPDYTPPGSPNSRPKGVLRPGSKYQY